MRPIDGQLSMHSFLGTASGDSCPIDSTWTASSFASSNPQCNRTWPEGMSVNQAVDSLPRESGRIPPHAIVTTVTPCQPGAANRVIRGMEAHSRTRIRLLCMGRRERSDRRSRPKANGLCAAAVPASRNSSPSNPPPATGHEQPDGDHKNGGWKPPHVSFWPDPGEFRPRRSRSEGEFRLGHEVDPSAGGNVGGESASNSVLGAPDRVGAFVRSRWATTSPDWWKPPSWPPRHPPVVTTTPRSRLLVWNGKAPGRARPGASHLALISCDRAGPDPAPNP